MGLVQNNHTVLRELVVQQALSQQHTISHVFDHGVCGCAVLKTDGIPHLFTQTAAKLLGHTLGHAHGGNTPGLRAANLALCSEAHLCQVLCHLGGLSGPRLTNHHQRLIVLHSLHELLLQVVDRQALSLLPDGSLVSNAIRHGLAHGLCLPLWHLIRHQANAPQLLSKGTLSGVCHGILPWPGQILGNGIQQGALLLVLQLLPLLGQRTLCHS
mmetsp:Transcript_1473/g.3565  ORF Transcript_1473/g.3565 Transcript_1473/m.3565 type:complete len:213 (-) Transcript_1473:1550-2188(-)